MNVEASRFYNSISRAGERTQGELIDFFLYHLTVEKGADAASTAGINNCFLSCDLTPPAGTAQYLSRGLSASPQRTVKVDGGYRLQRQYKDYIVKELGGSRLDSQISVELRSLEAKLLPGAERDFIKETIDCFEAGANRAAIIMSWIASIDHLQEFILSNCLDDFNRALAANTDKRVRVSNIGSKDDFSDIPEGKFIELMRSAKIISNDVRKILEVKLGIRNSCAHPSRIVISKTKAVEFIEDLLLNVIIKY